MTDKHLFGKPDPNPEFNLSDSTNTGQELNGSLEHAADASEHTVSTAGQESLDNHQGLDYRAFSPGFSDDEDSGEAFERSWPSHQAKKQATMAAKSKKSPRRSDNESEKSEARIQAKKPRQSLFGRADEGMDIDKQINGGLAPAPPGFGLGNMSSLTLDQQHGKNEIEYPVRNSFSLACSDTSSIPTSTPPSDEEVAIPPDAVVSTRGF